MRMSSQHPPRGPPLSRPSAAPGLEVKPPQPPTLRSARAVIRATPSQVGTGRGGLLTSLLPAPCGQSISQSPISCSAPSFLPHAPASLASPAAPFPMLSHSCSCIPHRDSTSPLVLRPHAPASPLHTSASPCSCVPPPHPHPPAMVLHPQFLLHLHPPMQLLHPRSSSFLHPHIPCSCIPIPPPPHPSLP